ncbi:peroxiredoxin family protein [Elusimicrobiota bacterium]
MLEIMQHISKEFSEDSVYILGICPEVSEKELKGLIKANKITFPVVLEKKKVLSSNYLITTYPTVFLVDSDGIIRQIYTGYFPDIINRIERDIHSQMSKSESAYLTEDTKADLQEEWNILVKISDMAISDAITTLTITGDLLKLSEQGTQKGMIKTGSELRRFEECSLDEDVESEYVLWSKSGREILCIDNNGKKLWDKAVVTGINELVASDIAGTGVARIIAGLSGCKGIAVMDGNGKEVWSTTEIVNALGINALDIDGDGFEEILAFSNDENLYIFSKDGELKKVFNSNMSIDFMTSAVLHNSKPAILISGSSKDSEIIKLLDVNGSVKWEIILGDALSSRIIDAKIDPVKDLIATLTSDGRLVVFDTAGNVNIQQTGISGSVALVDWLVDEKGQSYLILADTKNGISKYLLLEDSDVLIDDSK